MFLYGNIRPIATLRLLIIVLVIQSMALFSRCRAEESSLCRLPCRVQIRINSEANRSLMGFTHGEAVLVDRYVDRWFDEPQDSSSDPDLCLLFKEPNKIFEINCRDLKIESYLSEDTSFAHFLSAKNVVMENHPLRANYLVSTSDDGHHKFERWFGNFAWDIQSTREGKLFTNKGEQLENHFSYGETVYSPVRGKIANIVRDRFDRPVDLTLATPIPSDEKTPNYILIHIQGPFYFELVHFKQGSIPKNLKIGDQIEVGDFLGEIGNSGVSFIPHLHITSYYKNSKGRFMSIPTLLANETNGSIQRAHQAQTGQEFRFCESQFN